MPAKRADHRHLAAIAGLQGLRVAREEMALHEARETLRDAQHGMSEARERLAARESELDRLLASGSFAPDRLQLQSALLLSDADTADQARQNHEIADTAERERTALWQASRRQHEQLLSAQRDAKRRFAARAEERALAAQTFPLAAKEPQP